MCIIAVVPIGVSLQKFGWLARVLPTVAASRATAADSMLCVKTLSLSPELIHEFFVADTGELWVDVENF